MTKAEFWKAVARGQGRAIVAVTEGRYLLSPREIQRLLLRSPLDGEQEAERWWYAVELVLAANISDQDAEFPWGQIVRLKGPSRHRKHRIEICFELANRGVARAKDAIYAYFSPEDDFRCAQEIIRLDGTAGLEWVIAHSHGYLLSPHFFAFWMFDLENVIGKDELKAWVTREILHRADLQEFIRSTENWPPPKPPREPQISFDEFVHKWKRSKKNKPSFLSWTSYASKEDLAQTWRNFEVAEDFEWLRCLSLGLRHHSELADLERLIDRARAWERDYNPFINAMSNIRDRRLRIFGLELIERGRLLHGMKLLASNLEVGDESLLLETAISLIDSTDLHGVILSLLKVRKEIQTVEILDWIVDQSPCSLCRNSAVRDLIEIGKASDSILQECLFDIDSDTRAIARTALDGAQRLAEQPY